VIRGVGLVLTALALSASAQSLEQRKELCFTCHGANGTSSTPFTPSLGGQPSFFVLAQLFLFREGRRMNEELSAPMTAAAARLTDAELQALADLIAKQPPPRPRAAKPDPARFASGRGIAERERCGSCHNPDFSGRDNMPRLANQREDYLLKALRDYKKGVRTGYGNAAMPEIVSGLSDTELADVAHFLARLR
jgi:cytochrome c553